MLIKAVKVKPEGKMLRIGENEGGIRAVNEKSKVQSLDSGWGGGQETPERERERWGKASCHNTLEIEKCSGT